MNMAKNDPVLTVNYEPMKSFKITLLFFSFVILWGCQTDPANSEADPVERAEAANASRIENAPQLEADATFMVNFADYMYRSLKMAAIADERVVNPDVRAFSDSLQREHRLLFDQLQKLGKEHRITLPDDLSDESAEQIEALRDIEQLAFDEYYLNQIIANHMVLEKATEQVLANTKVQPVIDFCANVEEMRYRHLKRARKLKGRLVSELQE